MVGRATPSISRRPTTQPPADRAGPDDRTVDRTAPEGTDAARLLGDDLLAADPVVVAVEVRRVPGLASPGGRLPRGPDRGAVLVVRRRRLLGRLLRCGLRRGRLWHCGLGSRAPGCGRHGSAGGGSCQGFVRTGADTDSCPDCDTTVVVGVAVGGVALVVADVVLVGVELVVAVADPDAATRIRQFFSSALTRSPGPR
jgi:hypothetical protein